MNSRKRLLALIALLALATTLVSCGGGGGASSSNSTTGGNVSVPIVITTAPILPGTLQNHPYNATLSATGGRGALRWTIGSISPTALFVQGLTMDPGTGALSGTANWAGTAGFFAVATDADSQTATKAFTITANSPLSAPASKSATIGEFQGLSIFSTDFQGGVPPLAFSLTGGSLPPGIRVDPRTGLLTGSSLAVGNFLATITISDSFSPPEVVTQQVSVKVVPAALQVASSLPSRLPVNVPFSGKVVASGGTPPYHFAFRVGTLPVGFSPIDPVTGVISGTPTSNSVNGFSVQVTDSATPAQSVVGSYLITVDKALSRNDTVATATPIGNGVFLATISPYIDPPNKAPLPGDSDYYKIVSVSGATVHVQPEAKLADSHNPLDTVLEIVDGNGVRFASCRQPGDTTTTFNSSCLNDDASATTQDSALDFKVPGAASTPTAFFVHVFDWRGDARPDMFYNLVVNGVVPPLDFSNPPLIPAARGLSYNQQLTAGNATGTTTLTIVSGALPPGLSLSASGAITGAATTIGLFPFTVQATDSSTPPQKTIANFTIQVVTPIAFVSAPTFTVACLNQPYTFPLQISGGIPPIFWGFASSNWPISNPDQSTGVFSGTPTLAGTFTGTVSASDNTTHGVSQKVSLTVKSCP